MAVIKYKGTDGSVKELGLVVPMDSALSDSSECGVQNKVIKNALDGKQDKLTAGTNITIDDDGTISAALDGEIQTYSNATTSQAGLMSASDKSKLDAIASGANNYTLPVAGEAIGGVKSGTDITVDANGNVSINDDSHNHIISNIDGLQTALDGKGTYSKPEGGIPKTDLASAVQTSLGLADTALQSHQDISGKLDTSLKGANNGLAELDANGKVPSSQLPSYVDDVLEYNAQSNFPSSGETGKIYIAKDTNKTYRWSGSAYVVISETLALGETSSTAYAGDKGKTAYDHSQSTHARTDATKVESSSTNGNIKINGTETTVYTHPSGTNPHNTTKSDVGLGNVENKSSATIRGELTKANVTDALGYTPPQTDTNTTYTLTQDSSDGHKLTFTPSSGTATTITIPDNNTTYSAATTSTAGLMSAEDKTKLNAIASGANNYTLPVAGSSLGGVKSGTDITVDANGNVSVNDDSHNHIISNVDGLQTALDGKASSDHTHSAYVNQNAFSNIAVGSTTVAADSATDTLTFEAGSNITITPDSTNDKITISATDTTYSDATTSASGLMSSADKTKLNGVSSGANKVEASTTNGNIKIDGTETTVFTQKLDQTILLSEATGIANITVELDNSAKGSSPYNTSYYYTNITVDTTKVNLTEDTLTEGSAIIIQLKSAVTSNNRNVRIRFSSSGTWIPLYNTTSILGGNSFLGASTCRVFVYSTVQRSEGAFHMLADSNSTYSPAGFGGGYGTCATAEATVAKVVTLSSYTLTTGGIVAVKFTYAVPASATMNINSKGAKSIYYNDAAITAGIIEAGDIAIFVYTGSRYELLAINKKIELSGFGLTATAEELNYVDGVTSNIQTQLNNKSNSDHTHSSYVNQNAFSNVVVGSTTVAADSATDTLTFVAGSNITITPDATNDKITIASTDTNTTYTLTQDSTDGHKLTFTPSSGTATTITIPDNNTTYNDATTTTHGLMSTSDKSKLDGIAAGATANVGTITGITMNGASKGTSGVVDLGTVITAHQDISGKLDSSLKGANNGLAELGADGKVPSSQLPSYVDDVLEYDAQANFPTTGETGKIYVAKDTNKTYRWTGSAYVEISASLALGETSSTAYRGDKGKTAYDHSQSTHARTDATKVESSSTNGNIKINGAETTVYTHPTGTNPHGTTKSDLGLGNVENKSSATIRGELTKANVTDALGYTPPTTDTNTTYTLTQDASDGHKITLTPSSGTATTITIPDNNTIYSNATTSAAGLMSSTDKSKLDGIASGATANAGTVTSVAVKMNNTVKGTVTNSGTIDLGTVITSHQDISGKEDISNKVTSISVDSTDTEYPSAKAVYSAVSVLGSTKVFFTSSEPSGWQTGDFWYKTE